MSDYTIARLEDIPETNDGRCPWRPVRHHFGIESFGINTWTGHAAGDRIINEHDEADVSQEELYLVLSGRAVFELDGERREAGAGTFVFVRPAVKRTAFAEEAGTTVLALGGVPGKAYQVFGWEIWAPVNALYQAGEYEEAAARGRELADANPQYPGLLYNVACCESLAGDRTGALEHLRRSIELSDEFRGFARGDSDLDAIRDDPAFAELVGGES